MVQSEHTKKMSISSTYMWQVLLNEYSIVDPCHIYSLTLSSNRWIGKWVGERGHLLIAKSDFRPVESNWFEMMVSSFHICFPWVCIKILDCLSTRIHQFSNKYVHQSNITGSCKRPYFLHNASLKQERGQWLLFVFFLTAIYHSSLQSFQKIRWQSSAPAWNLAENLKGNVSKLLSNFAF